MPRVSRRPRTHADPASSGALLRSRIWVAGAVLGLILLAGTFGLWGLGRLYLGAHAWSVADCAFFVVITITTVGYGELPHLGSVPGGHLLTVVVLLSGLGVSVYCFSALTTFFVEGEFSRARQRRRIRKMIDNLRDHIIVCGAGTTGIHVVEELITTGWPVVAIDVDPHHLERAQALSPSLLPTIQGDATEDAVLEQAGIRRARGLVAALTDDKANLFIVVTARELNPNLKIVAKGVDMAASEKLKRAGADSVVNPAFIGGVRMVSEMIRPQVVEFLDMMLRDKDKNLRLEEVTIPERSSFIGTSLKDTPIRRETRLLVIAVRLVDREFVYNPDPDFVIAAGTTLIVMGETESVVKLRSMVGLEVQRSSVVM
jgi:voltage-gated potassium channel